MKKRYITNPNLRIEEIKLEYSKIVKRIINGKIEDGITGGFGFKRLPSNTPYKIAKIYHTGGRIFVYCVDNKVYEYVGDSFKVVCDSVTAIPTINQITYQKADGLLLAFNNKAIIVTDSEKKEIDLELGEFVETLKGRIFTVKEGNLYYGDKFDFSTFSYSFELNGYIGFEEDLGEIIGLYTIDDILYAIFNNGVYSVRFTDGVEEIEVKKIVMPDLNVKKGNVVRDGDIIYLLEGEKLWCLNKGALSKKDGFTLNSDYMVKEFGVLAGEMIVLSVTIDGVNGEYLCLYDLEKRSTILISYQNSILSSKGLTVNAQKTALTKIDLNSKEPEKVYFESYRQDLGSCNFKSLLNVEVNSDCQATLTIEGQFGIRNYSLKNGCNQIRCNLWSDYYLFRIEALSVNSKIDNLKIKYNVAGE